MTVVLFQQTPKIFVISLKSLVSEDIKIIMGVLYVKYQSQ